MMKFWFIFRYLFNFLNYYSFIRVWMVFISYFNRFFFSRLYYSSCKLRLNYLLFLRLWSFNIFYLSFFMYWSSFVLRFIFIFSKLKYWYYFFIYNYSNSFYSLCVFMSLNIIFSGYSNYKFIISYFMRWN